MSRRAFLTMLGHRFTLTNPVAMAPPPALSRGDPISVAATLSPTPPDLHAAGLARLAARYRLQGSEPDARAVFVPREGCTHGAAPCAPDDVSALRFVPRPPWPSAPKPFVGFSDATAIHATLQTMGRISVHGPVVTQLARLPDEDFFHLTEVLENPHYRPCLMGRTLHDGPVVEGPVVGGNLSVFTRLLGTPYLPPLDGAILFLEEMGEPLYRIDAMWQHLAQAGVFEQVVGLAFGEWVDCDGPDALLAGLAQEVALPCVSGLPCGHGDRNLAFPLGARARLDTELERLVFLEGAVAAP